jgi:hypothetical protein
LEAIERQVISPDWITLLFVFVLVLLAVVKYAYTQRFTYFTMLFATDKYLYLKGKDANLFHPFNMLLFLVNVITVGILVFVFYGLFDQNSINRPGSLFLRIATAYGSFVLLKFSLEKILANIISVDKKMNAYLFYKLSYRNFMALVLLPFCMFFVYVWEPGIMAMYSLLGAIFTVNLITLLSYFQKNRQYISRYWFYFILYLCALEIGPYFILYKLITKL